MILFSWDTLCTYTRTRVSVERTGSSHPRTGARARARHNTPRIRSPVGTRYAHTRARRRTKKRTLATSNAATASACAPLYVSQGRHVRLRTTYLYISPFALRARSSRRTNFPERRNRTCRVPDVLRSRLTLPSSSFIPLSPLPSALFRGALYRALVNRLIVSGYCAMKPPNSLDCSISSMIIRFNIRLLAHEYLRSKLIFFRNMCKAISYISRMYLKRKILGYFSCIF